MDPLRPFKDKYLSACDEFVQNVVNSDGVDVSHHLLWDLNSKIESSYFHLLIETIAFRTEELLKSTAVDKSVDFRKRLDVRGLKQKYKLRLTDEEKILVNGLSVEHLQYPKVWVPMVIESHDVEHFCNVIVWDILRITSIEKAYRKTVLAVETFTQFEEGIEENFDQLKIAINNLVAGMKSAATSFKKVEQTVDSLEEAAKELVKQFNDEHHRATRLSAAIKAGKQTKTAILSLAKLKSKLSDVAERVQKLRSRRDSIFRKLLPGYIEATALFRSVEKLTGSVVQTYKQMALESREHGFADISNVRKFAELKKEYDLICETFDENVSTLRRLLSRHPEFENSGLAKMCTAIKKTGLVLLSKFEASIEEGWQLSKEVGKVEEAEQILQSQAVAGLYQQVAERVNSLRDQLPFMMTGSVDRKQINRPHMTCFVAPKEYRNFTVHESGRIQLAFERVLDNDVTLLSHPHVKASGIPELVVVPVNGNGVFLKALNTLVLPISPYKSSQDANYHQTVMRSVTNLFAFYRLEIDAESNKQILSKKYANLKKIALSNVTTYFVADYANAHGAFTDGFKKSIGGREIEFFQDQGLMPTRGTVLHPWGYLEGWDSKRLKVALEEDDHLGLSDVGLAFYRGALASAVAKKENSDYHSRKAIEHFSSVLEASKAGGIDRLGILAAWNAGALRQSRREREEARKLFEIVINSQEASAMLKDMSRKNIEMIAAKASS
ncbi:MAG: hypothetical protein NUW37_18365 [Planctomycetes bacterium]|nr:hypothetical protein [Planctomycetota bacterium]